MRSATSNAEAGPSHVPASQAGRAQPNSASTAPLRPLPSTHLYSIEYPGYVQSTSIPLALERLGGRVAVETVFKKAGSKLELNLRPGNPFAHPIPGEVVPTSNILLKVVKRRRKKSNAADGDSPVGEYTIEALGVIPKTARFRSMADYQFQPDMDDPISKLRTSMDTMDVEGILNYSIQEEQEDYTFTDESTDMDVDIDPQLRGPPGEAATLAKQPKIRSNLRLLPPPLFSRQGVPQLYSFKANPASVVTTITDEETGEEKKRLINRMRWKGFGPIAIDFSEKTVPEKPSEIIEEQRKEADKKLLKRLEELFQERPIWTRTAIFNQFTAPEVREIFNAKYLLPLVSYVFQDGPWRDTQVRLGYDPRRDPQARFYQRVYFRNINHPITRPSVVGRRQEARTDIANTRMDMMGAEDKQSHIFDGKTMSKETAAYQLCDLTDPMLKEMVEDDEDLRETCNERDGWYTTHAFERIKAVLRHKFFSLLSGHIASREECEALLGQDSNEKPRAMHRIRPGKHNMAKGAMKPEDAAAQRLMAVIDQRAKNFSVQQSQREPKRVSSGEDLDTMA